MIEPFKYVITPVAIERDDDGKVLREIVGEAASAYSLTQATELIKSFEQQIVAAQNGKEAA